MFEVVHRLGSRIRHDSFLAGQKWLWEAIEPGWQWLFRLSSSHGFATRINDDVFKLEYNYAARYDRSGSQEYEPIVSRALLARMRPGMTVFDVGAHIGLLSLVAAKRVGISGRVFAFEPSPGTFRSLDNHVRFNDYRSRIETINAVVSDADGHTPFYVYGDSMAASLGRGNLDELNPQRLSDPSLVATEIMVPTLTLDRFSCERHVDPDVLKIDVEGAELLVLRGAREVLRRKPVEIICEVHPLQMKNCGSSVDEFQRYLDEIGYGIERLDDAGPQGIFHTRMTIYQ